MSLKRKATVDSRAETVQKKSKADFFAPRAAAAASSQPKFTFEKKQEGAIRLTAWNVNGIKSVEEKTLKRYLDAEEPDILILTETKYAKGRPDILCLKTRFKHQVWGTDPKPGQAGTAVLSKLKPIAVLNCLPTWPENPEETAGHLGFIQLEFETIYIVGTYVPNSGDNFKSMDLKQKWNAAFKDHIHSLDSQKPVIWVGDLNCILSKKDLDAKAQTFWNTMSGLSETERMGLEAIMNPEGQGKLKDAWRHLHPDDLEFTHSSPKFGAWRLDSFVLSERILERVLRCDIRHELKDLKLSDHWPVTIDLSEPL